MTKKTHLNFATDGDKIKVQRDKTNQKVLYE